MKKILFILLVVLVVASCQKKENEPATLMQDVVFAAEWVDPGSTMKSTTDDPPAFPCSNLTPDYAFVIINGISYYPDLFTLDNKLYTQSIKLPVPSGGQQAYSISQFWLMHDMGSAGYGPEDVVVMATPITPSAYSVYVSAPVTFGFTVNAFSKAEIPIQVLCFQADTYDKFGFDWFVIDEIVVREQCFFGDICLNGQPFNPSDYNGSLYGTNLGLDIPAIMKIDVTKTVNNVTTSYPSANNEAWKGIGAPLCVKYPDDINVQGEVFVFTLNVWIWYQNQWQYYNFGRFTCTDAGPMYEVGGTVDLTLGDNVVDYVIGTCVYTAANKQFNWPQN